VARAGVPHHGASARAMARHQLVRDLPGATEAAVVGACTMHALASLTSQTSDVLGELTSDGVLTGDDVYGRSILEDLWPAACRGGGDICSVGSSGGGGGRGR
jgi:hypothetical protein